MSGNTLKLHGNRTRSQFVVSSFHIQFVSLERANCIKPLPPRTRQHVDFTSSQYFPSDDTSAVANKKRKIIGAGTDQQNAIEYRHQVEELSSRSRILSAISEEEATTSSLLLASYWESGDSRKLFAQQLLYGLECDVQKIVLDRIEKLERVNCFAADWREFLMVAIMMICVQNTRSFLFGTGVCTLLAPCANLSTR